MKSILIPIARGFCIVIFLWALGMGMNIDDYRTWIALVMLSALITPIS